MKDTTTTNVEKTATVRDFERLEKLEQIDFVKFGNDLKVADENIKKLEANFENLRKLSEKKVNDIDEKIMEVEKHVVKENNGMKTHINKMAELQEVKTLIKRGEDKINNRMHILEMKYVDSKKFTGGGVAMGARGRESRPTDTPFTNLEESKGKDKGKGKQSNFYMNIEDYEKFEGD